MESKAVFLSVNSGLTLVRTGVRDVRPYRRSRALLRNDSIPSYAPGKQARGYEAFTRRFRIPFMCECCGAQMHNA